MAVDINITGEYKFNGVPIGGGGGGLKGVHGILPITESSARVVPFLTNTNAPLNSNFVANRLIAYPFIPANNFTSQNIYININTGALNSLCRIGIYDNLNGIPNQLLFISPNIDCSTNGIKSVINTFNFVAGNVYWFAFHGGSVVTSVTHINQINMIPIRTNPSGTTAFNMIFSGQSFDDSTPAIFPAVNFFNGINVPLIGIQI